MRDTDSYAIVVPGNTLNVSCPGSIISIDVYSAVAHTSLRIYVLRESDNSRRNSTRLYNIVSQTEFKTTVVGIERHVMIHAINVLAGDVIAMGYFENNPVSYSAVSGPCPKENRCSWYHTNSTEKLLRESRNNATLSFTEADDTAAFTCRVYSIRLTLKGKHPDTKNE